MSDRRWRVGEVERESLSESISGNRTAGKTVSKKHSGYLLFWR
ncbi:hypothetical protein RSSM_04220 [Rhodopirellula sallentina SM41]|uniref:Uncharacterized protein n=1 Tax=Rhodopirellula sallentina SM41 TaxID=1263870 RepID=M5U905_9BACT|nr:hypothetical protein RSSM_04220 [Rhodopirellula sallentina SM41]